jgi:hypothetical protein
LSSASRATAASSVFDPSTNQRTFRSSLGASAFYVGSSNLYWPWNLSELGFVVDNIAKADELKNTYWTPVWHWASSAEGNVKRPQLCQQ